MWRHLTGVAALASLFSLALSGCGKPTAAERLNAGCFDIYLADPRDAPAVGENGAKAAPPLCRGHLRGSFSFFFERGRPAQPFP